VMITVVEGRKKGKKKQTLLLTKTRQTPASLLN